MLRGENATGLLGYLFGPGEANEHVNPRVIAGWEGYPEPATVEGRPDHRKLGALLDATWRGAGMTKDDKPVYHVSVALAKAVPEEGLPADPHISDRQFAEVADAMVRRVGLDPCRWVAVRHDVEGATHAHIVATLATESGKRWHPLRGDFFRLGEAARDFEAKWNLRRTPARDGSAPARETRGETAKTTRNGWRQPTRTMLREQVRAVAGASESVEDFLRRLAAEGVLVEPRLSPTTGEPTGYSVAIDRTSKDGKVEQVWFGGGKLAADLTLPKLRQRWDGAPHVSRLRPGTVVDRAAVWESAVRAAGRATAAVDRGDMSAAWAASDFLASAARVVQGREGQALREAARGFERAGFAGRGEVPAPSRAGAGLRAAGAMLSLIPFVRDDTQRLLALMAQLAALADAITRMRESQERAAQADAARRAAEALRHVAPSWVSSADERPRARGYTRLREMTL